MGQCSALTGLEALLSSSASWSRFTSWVVGAEPGAAAGPPGACPCWSLSLLEPVPSWGLSWVRVPRRRAPRGVQGWCWPRAAPSGSGPRTEGSPGAWRYIGSRGLFWVGAAHAICRDTL